MPKSREALATISVATLLALGVTGCGGKKTNPNAGDHPKPAGQPNYTAQMKQLGASLLNVAAEDSHRAPPFGFAESFGVQEPTRYGGQLTIEAGYGLSFTTNKFFGPLQVTVSQTFPDSSGFQEATANGSRGGFNIGFQLGISQEENGSWDTDCTDNAPGTVTVAETGSKVVYYAAHYSTVSEAAAQAVLTNEIAAARYAIQLAGQHVTGGQVDPMPDACIADYREPQGPTITIGKP